MADLSDVYTALQSADAAGDTAGAQQLADYLRTQSAVKPQYTNNTVLADGSRVPVGSTEAQAANAPTGSFLQNSVAGVGKFYTDALLGAQQLFTPTSAGYEGLTTQDASDFQSPANAAQLQQQIIDKRQVDAPLQATGGGKVGEVAGSIPFAFLPGVNSVAGAGALGGVMGAIQPTVGDESHLLNAGIGAGTGSAGSWLGNKLGGYLTRRAAEPFMGWNPSTANQVASSAIGSSAKAPNQAVIGDATNRIGAVFNQVRSPNVSATLGNDTVSAIDSAGSSLNRSTRTALENNDNVNDLLQIAANNQPATAQQLGQISSKLGADARSQMTSKDGDRALGRALFDLQSHVDDVVGSTITDPNLAAAYSTARGQYRSLSQITANPTILNSATGEVNMTALGKYLQRTDKPGYLRGGNQSELYNAARWGQTTGEGKGAPALELGNFGLPWLKYQALNNPITNATAGAVSRVGAPIAPQVGSGLQGLAFGSTPIALPYLQE